MRGAATDRRLAVGGIGADGESRPRVLLISRAYADVGHRPQLEAFRDQVDLTTVMPDLRGRLVFGGQAAVSEAGERTIVYPRLPLPGGQYVLRSLTLRMRERPPDVVVVTYEPWLPVYWQARLAARLFAPRAKLICGVKKNTYRRYPSLRGAVKKALGRAGLRGAARLVVASERAAGVYEREFGLSRARIAVATRSGVDTELFSPRAEATRNGGALVVGYSGRLSDHKGVLDLVSAVERCRAKGANLRLELLGEGHLAGELRAMAADRGWLRVHGPVTMEQVASFMRTLDLYVLAARILPDREEHDAHALLQALATGLPCVGTDSGIIPEVLGSGEGLLVPAADPEALAAEIGALARDPKLREALGEAGRQAAVARYSVSVVASAHARIWRQAYVEGSRRPPRWPFRGSGRMVYDRRGEPGSHDRR